MDDYLRYFRKYRLIGNEQPSYARIGREMSQGVEVDFVLRGITGVELKNREFT